MKLRILFSAMALLSVASFGCSVSLPHPYPARGQSMAQMMQDRSECDAWAQRETGFDPAKSATVGAAIGALLGAAGGAGVGAIGGAIGGNTGKGAGIGAAVGAVTGAVGGGIYKYSKDEQGYIQAWSACMTAKGYVLGK